jgi:hypothetical protein
MYVDKNIKDIIITEPDANPNVELERIDVNFNSMGD